MMDFAPKSRVGCDDSLTQKSEETPGIFRTNEFSDAGPWSLVMSSSAPRDFQKVMFLQSCCGILQEAGIFLRMGGFFQMVGDYWRLELFVFI